MGWPGVSSGLADGLKEIEIWLPKGAFHALSRMGMEQGIPVEVPGSRLPVPEDPAVRIWTGLDPTYTRGPLQGLPRYLGVTNHDPTRLAPKRVY